MKKLLNKTSNILTLLTITLLLIATNSNAFAQEKKPDNWRIGGFAGLNFNSYSAEFQTFPNVATCCPGFKDGSGNSYNFGGLFEYPIAKNLFVSGRLGLFGWDGNLSRQETMTIYDEPNDSYTEGKFEHTLEADIKALAFEPTLNYRLFANLFIHGGFQLSFANITADYAHEEKIIEPTNILYENGIKSRLISNGPIDDINSMNFSLLGGISYEFYLDKNRSWIVAPEIFYRQGMNDMITDTNWTISTLRIGASIKYSPSRLIEKKILLNGDVNAFSVERNGFESQIVTLKIEEFLSTNMKPLLTYVFFDENSAALPDRYIRLEKNETTSFSEDDLYNMDALETYYYLLNIIGKRMQQYPDAKIAIDGCNSGKGYEKDNKKLSERRAETVRNYLRDVWNISEERMIVGKRNLPQEPSNIKDNDGIEENRRVEITSNKWEIIAPVQAKDTFRITTPPTVRFKTEFNSDAGIREFTLTAYQDKKVLKEYTGLGSPTDRYDWDLDVYQKEIPRSDDDIDYQMVLIDKKDQIFETEKKSIPVEQITIRKKKRERIKDKYIDRFSLILFSFDDASLSFYNKKVADIIQKTAKSNSEIQVVGHTDRMGNDDYNLKLSKRRAKVVARSLSAKVVTSYGFGEKHNIYDNDLPEGRFYCRRVDVIVETPIEN